MHRHNMYCHLTTSWHLEVAIDIYFYISVHSVGLQALLYHFSLAKIVTLWFHWSLLQRSLCITEWSQERLNEANHQKHDGSDTVEGYISPRNSMEGRAVRGLTLGLLCCLQQVAPKAVQACLRVAGRMGPCVELSLGQAQELVLTSCELTLSPAAAPHCRGGWETPSRRAPVKKKTCILWTAGNLCHCCSAKVGKQKTSLNLITGGNEYFHDAEKSFMNIQAALWER